MYVYITIACTLDCYCIAIEQGAKCAKDKRIILTVRQPQSLYGRSWGPRPSIDLELSHYVLGVFKLSTEYLVPNARYQVLGAKYQVLGTKCLVPRIWCQILCINLPKYLVFGTKHLVRYLYCTCAVSV